MEEFDKEFTKELLNRIEQLDEQSDSWKSLTSLDYMLTGLFMVLGILTLFIGWYV